MEPAILFRNSKEKLFLMLVTDGSAKLVVVDAGSRCLLRVVVECP
jgi:hypothetical protein